VAGQLRALDVSHALEKALVERSKIEATDGTLAPWTKEEIDKCFFGVSASFLYWLSMRRGRSSSQMDVVGSNCTMVPTRARAIGWAPKYTNEDYHAAVRAHVEDTFDGA
jgi:hypothetical protein